MRMTKEQKERKQQRQYYQSCLQKAIEEKNAYDIQCYTKLLKLMDTVDFYNENFY